MKKILFLFALLAVMAGCSKESLFEEIPSTNTSPTKKGYVFNFNVSADGETRAVKKTFVDGDKLFVFFDEVAGGMLTLEMSEGKWVATPNEALQSADLSATTSQNLVAVWVDGNKTPTLSDGVFEFVNTERMASAKTPYNIDGSEVTATIVMKHEGNSIKISVEIAGLEEDENPWILVGGNSQFAVTPDADGIWSAVSSTKAGDCEGIVYEEGEAKGVYFMVNPEIDLNKVTVIHDIDKYVREFEGKNAADYAGKAIKMTGPDYGNLDDVCNNWNHYVYYPDDIFRSYMTANFDTGIVDGEISISEAAAVETIDVNNKKITSLAGIEYCVKLGNLSCNANKLTSLDVSGCTKLSYLACSDNKLTSLDISGCTELSYLVCSNNKLTSVDISGLTNLQCLYCENNQLSSLNVSNCTELVSLYCGSNQLTSLDISGLTNLQYLSCSWNQLTSLDISGCTGLAFLSCGSNQLTSLGVSGCTALQTLYCYYNQLTSLDISRHTNLQCLSCDSNQLTSLNVSNCTELASLSCYNNQLTSLDISGLTNLQYLSCGSNQLTSLDISGYTELASLSCGSNQLTSLDISGCTELASLSCENNQLSSLDISGCTELASLSCENNQLTSLGVSGCTALQTLSCYNNQLTSLDLSKNSYIKSISCDTSIEDNIEFPTGFSYTTTVINVGDFAYIQIEKD